MVIFYIIDGLGQNLANSESYPFLRLFKMPKPVDSCNLSTRLKCKSCACLKIVVKKMEKCWKKMLKNRKKLKKIEKNWKKLVLYKLLLTTLLVPRSEYPRDKPFLQTMVSYLKK